jgi:hypothetical protein
MSSNRSGLLGGYDKIKEKTGQKNKMERKMDFPPAFAI